MASQNRPQVIALEEHYWDAEVSKTFEAGEARSPELRKRLEDLGALRINSFRLMPRGTDHSPRFPIEPRRGEVRIYIYGETGAEMHHLRGNQLFSAQELSKNFHIGLILANITGANLDTRELALEFLSLVDELIELSPAVLLIYCILVE